MADDFKDIQDQFKQMHEDLDQLTNVSKEQVEATQEQVKESKETKKQTKKVSSDFEKTAKDEAKDRKAILKSMQMQLRRTQMAQGASMSDVAAEHLAGGGGLGGAAKAAVGLKVAQFKHKFDPLNIVKKITGGSKLAIALAGKITGRSEQSVRSFADLAPGMDLPTPFFGKGKGFGSPTQERGARGGGVPGGAILEKMAVTLTHIHDRLTNIETIERLNAKLTQDQIDDARDTASVERAQKRPSRVGAIKERAKEAGTDFLAFMKGILDKFKFGLLGALALLGVAGASLASQWKKLKLSFSLLKDSAVEMWDGIKQAFTDAGKWITDKALLISDTFLDAIESIVDGIQNILFKVSGGRLGKQTMTPEERTTDLKQRAAQGEGRAIRKIARENEERIAEPGDVSRLTEKLAPEYITKVPAEAKNAIANTLRSTDLKTEAAESLMGRGSITGSPERVAAGKALTQMAARAYRELYHDDQGKPLSPVADKEHAAERLPAVIEQASLALSNAATAKPTMVSQAPSVMPQTPMTTVSPTEMVDFKPTGSILNQAAENKASAQSAQAMPNVVAPIITNKTINSSATTITQPMAGVRSDENSIQRSRFSSYTHP